MAEEETPGKRIGRNIRAVREAAMYSRNELAARAGVSASTIEDVELGLSARPRRTTIEKLGKALGVEAGTLIMEGAGGAEAPKTELPPSRSAQGWELLGRIRANISLLEHYMEHPPDEDAWDRALTEHYTTAVDGMGFAVDELEQAKAEKRPHDHALVTALVRADIAGAKLRPRLTEFNLAQYGHRHREVG